MTSPINYDLLPESLREGMRLYVEHGIRPGSFLEAVLKDTLTGAFSQADESNRARMFDIARFLYNEMPMTLWGSRAVVEEWIRAKAAERLVTR